MILNRNTRQVGLLGSFKIHPKVPPPSTESQWRGWATCGEEVSCLQGERHALGDGGAYRCCWTGEAEDPYLFLLSFFFSVYN